MYPNKHCLSSVCGVQLCIKHLNQKESPSVDREQEAAQDHPDPSPAALPEAPKPESAAPPQPATTQQLEEVEKKMSAFERATLTWARAAFIVACAAAAFACLQWVAMRQTLSEMKTSGDVSTNQVWQAIGNMNWLAKTADGSLHQTQNAIAENKRQSTISLNATIEQNRLDQRAWVGPVQVEDTRTKDAAGNAVFVTEGSASQFIVRIKNTGKTPAMNVLMQISDLISGGNPPPEFSEKMAKYETEGIGPESRSVMQPQQETGFPTSGRIIYTHDLIEMVKSSKAKIWVYGKITYNDVFRRPHKTIFCMELSPDLERLSQCKEYNEAD
jgi:hypothetical protein